MYQKVLSQVVIVASLTLAWMVNLLLPIDVRNSRLGPVFAFLVKWLHQRITHGFIGLISACIGARIWGMMEAQVEIQMGSDRK